MYLEDYKRWRVMAGKKAKSEEMQERVADLPSFNLCQFVASFPCADQRSTERFLYEKVRTTTASTSSSTMPVVKNSGKVSSLGSVDS